MAKHVGIFACLVFAQLCAMAAATEARGQSPDAFSKGVRRDSVANPWDAFVDDLFVCASAPSLCALFKDPPKNKNRSSHHLSLVAGAAMHHGVLGHWVSFIAVLCTGACLLLSVGDGNTVTDDVLAGAKDKKEWDRHSRVDRLASNAAPEKGEEDSSHLTRMFLLNRRKQRSLDSHDQEASDRNAMDKQKPSSELIFKQLLENAMVWWSTGLSFSSPVITFKLFVMSLIILEMEVLTAPEQSVLATPELISLVRILPDNKRYRDELVPPVADWLLPGLDKASADMWVQRLEAVRWVLLLSWFAFLLLPPRHYRASGMCYAIGAMAYVYLGSIGLMYDLSHSVQGTMLFVLAASLAVPSLRTNKGAVAWTRNFLVIGILVPTYLGAGISKFRYGGVAQNVSGAWLGKVFIKGGSHRSLVPSVYLFICNNKWTMNVISWGNIAFEIILPLAVILRKDSTFVLGIFHFSALCFHAVILVLMGPNFMRLCLLHVLALNPLGILRTPAQSYFSHLPLYNMADWLRLGLALWTLSAWFHVQFMSDFDHLLGRRERLMLHNPFFPIPEFSMYSFPTKPDYTLSLCMSTLSFIALMITSFSHRGFATAKNCKSSDGLFPTRSNGELTPLV